GIDVAIRAGAVRQPDLIARKVGQTDVFPVASPGYVEAHGLPMSPDELADHACLVGFEGSETPHRLWPLREGNGAVPVSGRLASNDLFLLCAAAEAGKGIALLPGLLTQPLVLEGRLVPVLEDQIGLTSPMSLVYASREFMDPKVRAFLDMAVEHFHMLFREGIPMQRPVQAS
ncbi:MAG: substrate binding domain-containing protein, partial [Myxococcota bacterium]